MAVGQVKRQEPYGEFVGYIKARDLMITFSLRAWREVAHASRLRSRTATRRVALLWGAMWCARPMAHHPEMRCDYFDTVRDGQISEWQVTYALTSQCASFYPNLPNQLMRANERTF